MKKLATLLMTLFVVTCQVASAASLYVLGEVNGNSWAPNVGVEMTTTDNNTFTATVTTAGENSGYSYFSFTKKLAATSNDWSGIASSRLYPVSDGDFWVLASHMGQALSLTASGSSEAFRIPAGTWTLTVDLSALTVVINGDYPGSAEAGQGWPASYSGVMLQGFYWDSYYATRWANLEANAQELGQYFDLIWVPNSGSVDANGTSQSMGYCPVYWLKHNSVFGSETNLRSMISTMKEHGVNVMMDLVINHKNGASSWTDFPDETVVGTTTGETYKVTWDRTTNAQICSTDECVAAGYTATGAADEGEDFDGARDLDHTNATTQSNVKTYMDFLLNELGYAGFRLDMCKGYSPYYVGLYNSAAQPAFSVGEYWDGNADNLRNWLNGTKVDNQIQSAVFDYALKYRMKEAFNSGNWSALNDKGLAGDANYNRFAVTFVDNQDTGQNTNADCMIANVMPANAFILAMPGTPCIFYKHYLVYTDEIQNCIKARRAAGVNSQSSIITQQESNGGYILETVGTHGSVYLQLGGATANGAPTGYDLVQAGDNYRFYVNSGNDWQHVAKDGSSLGYPVVDKASGNYVGSVTANVAPSASGTTLVYTTDGSDPTTSSSTLTAATGLTFTSSTTLKVGVLNGDMVENIDTYIYTIVDEATTGVTVYVNSDESGSYIWAWDAAGSNYTGGTWPGTAISTLPTVTVGGMEWHYLHVDASQLNVILNNGSGGFENQTAIIPVTRDRFFIYPNDNLTATNNAATDTYTDVTEQYAGGATASFSDLYILGEVNNVNGWYANRGYAMTTTDGTIYTAIVTTRGQNSGYSYFSFSTSLAETATAWSDIAADRFGAPSNNYMLDADDMGVTIQCGAMGTDNAFKIAAGDWNFTVNLVNRTLVVTPVVDNDVNGDGSVTMADVTTLIAYILGNNPSPCHMDAYDVNGDGSVTMSDVTSLIALLLGN